MRYEPEFATKWRMRAQELRARAAAVDDPEVSAKLLQLADEWERKAAAAEHPPHLRPPLRDE